MPAPAKRGILAGIDESFAISFNELREFAVVSVVAAALAGKQRAQAMMKIVVPLARRGRSRRARAARTQARVVVGAFGDQKNFAVEPLRRSMNLIGQFFEKSNRRMIENRVHRVEPQRIDMTIDDPVKRVLNEIFSVPRRSTALEIQRRTPRRFGSGR